MIIDLKALWQEAFGDADDFVEGFFQTGFSEDHCRCLYVQGKIAAALYWFDAWADRCKLAYIYAVATAKEFRGRGLCRQLITETHRHLESRGYSGAVLVPGEGSLFEFYKKLGYETFGTVREFSCAAREPISLWKLSREEYAAARREKLPRGGVIQEGPALAFLETFAHFWAGNDCLLAGAVQDDTLYVQEYLGDEAKAPAVTGALNAKKALFRTPGPGRPFAMYHSIDGTPAPGYFGLALD